jgi:hypothetical protein
MSWYAVRLPQETTETDRDAFEDSFADLFASAGRPLNAILYWDIDNPNRYYFSPRATALARTLVSKHSGTECSRPLPSAVLIAVGDEEASAKLLRRDG